MAKIALSMIVKDDSEANELRRCLKSVAPHVDGIFITGTKNPQEEIKKICKEFKAHWTWFEWIKDFSAARNFAFAQVPKEYEWIIWMDTDDMLHGGETLHQAAEVAEKAGVKAVFARYLYQVELDENGGIKQILIEHLRERLIRNDGTFEWVAPIHETLIEKVPANKTDFQGFMVVHLTHYDSMVNSMYRNIEILEEAVEKNPNDPRPIYYLAKAYFDVKTPEIMYEPLGEGVESLTIELLKDYLRKSGWAEERAQAWEYLSMIYREKNEFKKGISCLLEALSEGPQFPSIYIQLALCYVVLKDWSKALHWVKVAQNVEIPKTTLVINPKDYKVLILEALFHIHANTGKLELCEKVCVGLNELQPNDLNKQRLADIRDVLHRNNLAHWTVKMANHLHSTGQVEQLKALINSIPKEIVNEPVMMNLRNDLMPPKTWDNNSVVIYCGPGFEQWSPKSVSKGIGGSEEAVINLSKELVKLGWEVTVYADPRDDEGLHEGVNYLPYYHINWKDRFNVFVSWRQIQLFDVEVRANKKYLWNHDLQNPLTYTPERVKKIDKVMFLSKYHRSNVPTLPEDKIMYTANGVNI